MSMKRKGLLFVMSGPSGTGKGTICAEIGKTDDIFMSISNTTRDKRAGEKEGETYYYVSRDEFERMIRDGEMLEYAEYNGNYYGTNKNRVAEALEAGKDVLLEIEPQGALQIKKLFPDAVLIFVLPPSMETLKERLISRGRESLDKIKERINAAEWELSQQDKYDYKVINDDLKTCVKDVLDIFKKKRG